jgi:spermidine synthase
MRLISVTSLFLGLAAPLPTASQDNELKQAQSLIDWFRSKNGFLHSSLEFQRVDDSDPDSTIGMFTNTDIREGTLLFSIPDEVMIHSTDDELQQLDCGLVREVVKEIKKKDKSAYAPYLNYLLDTESVGVQPSGWSDAGKEMFMKALGDDDFDLSQAEDNFERYQDLGLTNTLPPSEPISWIENGWYQDCDGDKNDLEEFVALLVLQRSWDDVLIPIYDMIGHRNGLWLNTRNDDNGDHNGQSINVYASRDIFEGEQIYGSLNMCEDCGGRMTTYGTAEIFRDYGFIEEMPQTWIFPDLDLSFRMDELEDEDEEGNPQYTIIEWIDDDQPTEEDIQAFEEKLEYVQERIEMLEIREDWEDVPDNEWEVTVEYLRAMELSIQTVLQWHIEDGGDENCDADGNCNLGTDRFEDLDEPYETELEKGYPAHSCDIDAQFTKFDDGTFDVIETFKSQYQTITMLQDESNRDTCMDLDDTMQICGSYRPHYHEYMVHQTARFLPKDSIKRVLFVGGGDSMLLHETLKYPSLELVVGLELDQKVTRGCFKHFGTQPHFDDDRVEWWFGDAAKSLLMLPKDYFASFDLVLVDLSETVMSFSVSKELTVLEALTLLVKPDGIFVKNEVYFKEFQEMFPYTALVTWRDNPVICAQVMVMGSRTVDFMNPISGPTLTEHGIQNLVVRDLKDIDDDFELYHDYAYNATSVHLCDNISDNEESKDQVKSPGIMIIMEIEDVKADLTGAALQSSISSVLKEQGFSIKSSDKYQKDSNSFVYVTFKEGYVMARAFTDKKYVGFDIQLWSSTDKQKSVMNALIAAFGEGSSPSSSYRVITGGMFGVDTWMNDNKLHGPQFKELCKGIQATAPIVKSHQHASSEADWNTAFEFGLNLIGKQDLKVAILVGHEEIPTGIADVHQNAISAFDSVSKVVKLDCPSLVDFNMFYQFADVHLNDCKRRLRNVLTDKSDNTLFNAIIVDSTADKWTSSVLLELLSEMSLDEALDTDSIVLADVVNYDVDGWKKNLLLLLKDKPFYSEHKTAFVDFTFVNSEADHEFNLLVTNYAIENFVNRLNSTVVDFNAQKNSNLSARINVLNGGDWEFQEDFEPSKVYLPEDYDQSDPLAQWLSQKPLGHQAIVQLEPNPSNDKKVDSVNEKLLIKATDAAVSAIDEAGWSEKSVKKFCDVGEGCLFLALFESGTLTIQWDGRGHIDVVIFSLTEDIEMVDTFVDRFLEIIPSYTTMLRDEQPRGTGRVVSYQRDLEDTQRPHWAPLE